MNKFLNVKSVFLFGAAFGILFYFCALPAKAASSSLLFSPDSISIKKDSDGSVDIYLDSREEQIVGVDLVINFDPVHVELTNISDYGLLSYKVKEIVDNNSGKLKLAFSNDFGKYFSGSARLATIYFKSKSENSKSGLSFAFENGKTNDTNVVNKAGADVLGSVNTLTLTTPIVESEGLKPAKAADKPALNQDEKVLKASEENFIFPENIIDGQDPDVLGKETQLTTESKSANYFSYFLFACAAFLISVFTFFLGRLSNQKKGKIAFG